MPKPADLSVIGLRRRHVLTDVCTCQATSRLGSRTALTPLRCPLGISIHARAQARMLMDSVLQHGGNEWPGNEQRATRHSRAPKVISNARSADARSHVRPRSALTADRHTASPAQPLAPGPRAGLDARPQRRSHRRRPRRRAVGDRTAPPLARLAGGETGASTATRSFSSSSQTASQRKRRSSGKSTIGSTKQSGSHVSNSSWPFGACRSSRQTRA
jgi:hypothetical protein